LRLHAVTLPVRDVLGALVELVGEVHTPEEEIGADLPPV
jgi:hypothetical protein